MSEKEMVSRNVAIALGIICIILIALIAYFTVTGISAQNSYNTLQNQNKQLQTWLDGNETYLGQTQANNTNLQNQHNSDNSMLSSLNSSVTSLRKQVENLQNQANNLHLWAQKTRQCWSIMKVELKASSLGLGISGTWLLRDIFRFSFRQTTPQPLSEFIILRTVQTTPTKPSLVSVELQSFQSCPLQSWRRS